MATSFPIHKQPNFSLEISKIKFLRCIYIPSHKISLLGQNGQEINTDLGVPSGGTRDSPKVQRGLHTGGWALQNVQMLQILQTLQILEMLQMLHTLQLLEMLQMLQMLQTLQILEMLQIMQILSRRDFKFQT